MRIHTSPSIQITEIDKSQYSPSMTGTKVYIQGFASKGEAYKPVDITSRTAYTTMYGEPTNEAERYSYAAVCEVLNSNGKVCFARLPYDNGSFEKLLGYKYSVSSMKSSLSSIDSQWHEVYEADNEIEQYCEITAAEKPIAYDLAAIDEYRTDEAKVPANTFLIVDTTAGTYGKITEDTRKGDKRELIGIVPVVTTAANALLAQQLITVENRNVENYESISAKTLTTLSALNGGLLEEDLVKRINTRDFYFEQSNTFENVTIKTGSLIDLDPTIGSMRDGIMKFIQDYHLEKKYSIDTIGDMQYFYNNLKPADAPKVLSSDTVEELKISCESLINAIISSDWFVVDKETGAASPLSDFTDMTVPQMSALYHDEVEVAKKPLFSLPSSYINPAAIKVVKDEDGNTYSVATMVSATAMDVPEYHGRDGDDELPETMCQDANGFFAAIQPAADGEGFDPEHLKDIGVVVFKTFLDPSEGNKVSYEPVEAFCGSLYKDDKDPNTGVTKFIDTIINSQSEYINFFSNCFSSTKNKRDYLENLDILVAAPSNGASLGFFEKMTKKDISINKSIYDGMQKAQEKVSDINARDIDIVPDAGLANIASFLKAIYGDKGEYDLTVTDDLGNSMLGLWKCTDPASAAVKTWKTVEQKLDNFCKNVRKDCMFIADGLRPLVLQGQKKVIRDTKPGNTLDKNVIPYLKCIAGLNTSYGAGYMDWFEQADDYTGDFFWCPPSIKATGVYINTDVNYNYWDAPAGLNRGVIACTDVAFSPTAFQADLIYDKCWNYAINYPNDGVVLEGQKTLQTKPSALDRVNVRRLMLRLERATHQCMRWFLYEGNTAYLRQRVVDALDPYFKQAKVGGGLYDYVIRADETVNTPETIDNNELHVKIAIKPVKAIEFIMVDFVVGRTGSSWAELGL